MATYTYDRMHRPISLSIQEGGGSPQVVVLASPAATYQPFGPLASLTFDLGTDRTETRGYDLRYAPTAIAVSGDLFSWDYTTDALGNVMEIDQTQPSSASREYGYQDWQYFLTCAAGPWDASASSCDPVSGAPREWTYDRAGNRLSYAGAWQETYAYLQNGATSGNTSELDTVSGTGLQWHDYAFDAAGYQSSFEVMAGGNPLSSLDFTFDAAGQMSFVDASANKDASMQYDGRSFLAELAIADSPMLESTYSSEGLLHSLLRTPDPLQPSERINVLYFAGRPIGIWKKVGTGTATLTRIVTDHLGTPAASIQQAGSAVDWYGGFEPFGEDWQAGTAQDSLAKGIFLRMPGQWKDPLWSDATYPMELFYNVHRWYETQTGRYASPDPHRRSGFLSLDLLFAYAGSRPTTLVDPLGLKVVVPDGDLQGDYDRLKKCYPLFGSVAGYFEADSNTWTVSRPDGSGYGTQCGLGGHSRFSRTVWVPFDLGCAETLRCIFHEFYERWAIDGAGFPKSQMGAGPADNQARHFEQLLPAKKCCDCEPEGGGE